MWYFHVFLMYLFAVISFTIERVFLGVQPAALQERDVPWDSVLVSYEDKHPRTLMKR